MFTLQRRSIANLNICSTYQSSIQQLLWKAEERNALIMDLILERSSLSKRLFTLTKDGRQRCWTSTESKSRTFNQVLCFFIFSNNFPCLFRKINIYNLKKIFFVLTLNLNFVSKDQLTLTFISKIFKVGYYLWILKFFMKFSGGRIIFF